ncbi:tRNA uridine 5-carboxymethylaminomethyl modification enzyme MnmG [Bienertia sinuspersici]
MIDRSIKRPEEGSKEMVKWRRADHMVRCCLFRSMKEDIANGFIMVEFAKQLWEEVKERDAVKIEQEDMSVSEYYGKLKKYWDEISELEGIPSCECGALARCTCGVIVKLMEKGERTKIIDFLMKLNKNFDGIRGRILAMDPLPGMNEAFQLVYQAERERKLLGIFNRTTVKSLHFKLESNNKIKEDLQEGITRR